MSYYREVDALNPLKPGLKRECELIARRADAELAKLRAECEGLRSEVVRLKSKVNATFDAIHGHTSRAAAKRIFAAVKEFDPAARAGNGGEG